MEWNNDEIGVLIDSIKKKTFVYDRQCFPPFYLLYATTCFEK